MGGVQYTRNLIRAIALLPDNEKPDVVLHIGSKNKNQGYEEEFLRYPFITIDGPRKGQASSVFTFKSLARRIQRKIFKSEPASRIMISDDCSVAFPAKGPNISGPAQKIFWIPDFQYKNYPEYFTPEDRAARDSMYEKMFSADGILVLSSEAVANDFRRFFPQYNNKEVKILRFCTTFEDDDFTADPVVVCNKYNLPDKFVYLPNQMWQHKGFDTAFSALAILKKQGIDIPLVITGSTSDHRNEDYYNQLCEFNTKANISNNIYTLGLLPRSEQIQIFRKAALVLQPSRFEGWSTTVEDSRALGKKIILSDIDANKEQDPPNSIFFATGNEIDLARKLESAWNSVLNPIHPTPNGDFTIEAQRRSLEFARDFMSIATAVHEKTDERNSPYKELPSDLQIAALHDLLPAALHQTHFGPYFSKRLRAMREMLHPPGVEEVHTLYPATGLKINVNIGDRHGCDLFYGFFSEQSDFDLLMAMLKPEGIFIDVGANIGIYSLTAAQRVGVKGQVFAFEPDRNAYKLLRGNIYNNKLENIVSLDSACIGDHDGTVVFNESDESCLSSMIQTLRSPTSTSREVQIKTLDSICLTTCLHKIDAIKIDVEGAEAHVLSGARKLVAKYTPTIMLEMTSKNLDKAAVANLMDEFNYLYESGYLALKVDEISKKLFVYNCVEEILDNSSFSFNGNVFWACQTTGMVEKLRTTFNKIKLNMDLQHRVFKSRLPVYNKKKRLTLQLWAEKKKSNWALNLISHAYKIIDSTKVKNGNTNTAP